MFLRTLYLNLKLSQKDFSFNDTPFVIPEIKEETEYYDYTNTIDNNEEKPIIPHNHEELFVDNKLFVFPNIKKETESNTSSICVKEEQTEFLDFEQFVIKDKNIEVFNDTRNVDFAEEDHNSITKDVDRDDNINDTSELVELIKENTSSGSDNETLEQLK